MMMAAINPDLCGPIMLAGSPLSYWAGVRGKNPLRYLGGMLGGTWLTALAGDLGNGIFDGADLVANFEIAEPGQHLWRSPTTSIRRSIPRAARFLEFETWWGSPVLLNAEEMQWIADNLFVGNKLADGRAAHARRQCASTCAISRRRSSCSAPGATTSRRRSRRWAGSPICMTTTGDRRERPDDRLHDCTRASAISASSCPARWRRKEHGEFASAWT